MSYVYSEGDAAVTVGSCHYIPITFVVCQRGEVPYEDPPPTPLTLSICSLLTGHVQSGEVLKDRMAHIYICAWEISRGFYSCTNEDVLNYVY